MDLAALQAKVNNYTTVVGSWVKDVGNLYFSSTPQNVTVKLLDENGNVTTNTLPNAAQFRKTVWDDIGGALGQFDKSIYVDNVDGDDTNSGTSSSPVKTIRKAIELIPIGGKGLVLLKAGQTFEIGGTVEDNHIVVDNKIIDFNRYGSGEAPILTWKVEIHSGSYNNMPIVMFLYNAAIRFIAVDIKMPDKLDLAFAWTPYSGIQGAKGVCTIELHGTTLDLLSGAVLFRDGGWGSSGASILDLKCNHDVTIKLDILQVGKMLQLQFATGSAVINGSLVDKDGNVRPKTDTVGGIIKDTNGVPRNLNSNIIF